MSTLDFKQTIAFVNLANTLDYQYAAKKSGITVDELVRTIKALEEERSKLLSSQALLIIKQLRLLKN